MPLVDMRDMLRHAHRNRYAVGAFDLIGLDFLEAIMAGAEHCRAPVILSLAESHFEYFDFELAMAATLAAARRASVPVAIHLDHGASLDAAIRGIRFGCNGVMVDASQQPFDANARLTREVVEMAHGCGVAVEGELGYVAGVEGEDAERHPGDVVMTAPEEAAEFIARTGVDCLAVSIGTVHGRLRGTPRLDFERLARIDETLGMPLVIHGGTGLSDEQFQRLISHGVAKINYFTALSDAAGTIIRRNAVERPTVGHVGLMSGVRDAIRTEVERCIRLWGAADRADEVLTQAAPWREVEHLIVYNVEPEHEAARMRAEGRRVLADIPGVRAVHAGTAVQEQARYRHAWLIRFTHRAVIDSYRDHPDHVAYADTWFRPRAADRISIDFEFDD